MRQLNSDRKVSFYKCGRCKGSIRYYKVIPKVCTECGWGHTTRDVNDIPSELRQNLRRVNTAGSSGSRGILEDATIASR